MKAIKKILVPTDFSEGAGLAVQRALDLRQRLGAEITLLHAYQMPINYSEGVLYTPSLIREIEDAARGALASAKRDTEHRASDLALSASPPVPPPTITSKLVCAPTVLAIENEAREGGYDLIVMGTHGRTGLRRAILGSVAERVVRHAPCAVMTVRE